jgi:hypothetical protein
MYAFKVVNKYWIFYASGYLFGDLSSSLSLDLTLEANIKGTSLLSYLYGQLYFAEFQVHVDFRST